MRADDAMSCPKTPNIHLGYLKPDIQRTSSPIEFCLIPGDAQLITKSVVFGPCFRALRRCLCRFRRVRMFAGIGPCAFRGRNVRPEGYRCSGGAG